MKLWLLDIDLRLFGYRSGTFGILSQGFLIDMYLFILLVSWGCWMLMWGFLEIDPGFLDIELGFSDCYDSEAFRI